MAVTYINQRRPLTSVEVRDDDSLSARFYGRLADDINNLKGHVTRPILVLQHWPLGMQWNIITPIAVQWPRLDWPRGYTAVRFVVGWYRFSGTGTPQATMYARQFTQTSVPSGTEVASSALDTTAGSNEFTAGRISDVPHWPSEPTIIQLVLRLAGTGTGKGLIYTLKAWCEL